MKIINKFKNVLKIRKLILTSIPTFVILFGVVSLPAHADDATLRIENNSPSMVLGVGCSGGGTGVIDVQPHQALTFPLPPEGLYCSLNNSNTKQPLAYLSIPFPSYTNGIQIIQCWYPSSDINSCKSYLALQTYVEQKKQYISVITPKP